MSKDSNKNDSNKIIVMIQQSKEILELLDRTLTLIRKDPLLKEETSSIVFLYQGLIKECDKALRIYDNNLQNVTYISVVIANMLDTCLAIMLTDKDTALIAVNSSYTSTQKFKILNSLIKTHKKDEKIIIKSRTIHNVKISNILNDTKSELEPPKFFNEHEAAYYIGMSVSFLRKARADGKICNKDRGPKYLKIGKKVRYVKKDVDEWLMAHQVVLRDV